MGTTDDNRKADLERQLAQTERRLERALQTFNDVVELRHQWSERYLQVTSIDDPVEICRLFAEMTEVYLRGRGVLPGGATPDCWVWLGYSNLGIDEGLMAGHADSATIESVLQALGEQSGNRPVTEIVTLQDGSAICTLPVIGPGEQHHWWGVIGCEVPADAELDQGDSSLLNMTAMQLGVHLDRVTRIRAARIEAQHAAAAARVQQRLAEPLERADALRVAVEELSACDDIDNIAAVDCTDAKPTCIANFGSLSAEEVEGLVAERFESHADCLILPIVVDDVVEGGLVVHGVTARSLAADEMISGIAATLAGSIARRRASATIESLQRSTTRQLVEAQERERSVVAADIHDGVLQQLGATAMRLELACARIDLSDVQVAREIVHESSAQLRSCAAELRELLMSLRPQVLDDNGLPAALEELAKRSPDLNVKVNCEISEDEIGTERSIAVFRIVQEALNNVQKHARADSAWVDVNVVDGAVEVSVTDNGIGLSNNGSGSANVGKHLGLLGVRERANMLGGTFEIEGRVGHGTNLKAVLPL